MGTSGNADPSWSLGCSVQTLGGGYAGYLLGGSEVRRDSGGKLSSRRGQIGKAEDHRCVLDVIQNGGR